MSSRQTAVVVKSPAAQRSPKAVAIYWLPPIDSVNGASIRRTGLALGLGQLGLTLTVLLHEHPPDTVGSISAHLQSPVVVVPSKTRTRLGTWLRYLKPTLLPLPFHMLGFDPGPSEDTLSELLARTDPELIWCDSIESWLMLPPQWQHRAVIDLIDKPSLNSYQCFLACWRILGRTARRSRDPRAVRSTVRRLLVNADHTWRMAIVERTLSRRALGLAVSRRDEAASLLNGIHVPNGFMTSEPSEGCSFAEDVRLVLPATFSYDPNIDGTQWFLFKVLPLLRGLCPDARVVFAGRTTPELDHLMREFDVLSTGYVEDMAAVINPGAVVIVPLLSGSGTRIKILEAWSRGSPVVSTSKGAEGLDAIDGEHLLLADSPADFASACLTLLQDVELRDRLRRNAKAHFRAHYSWGKVGQQLRHELRAVAGRYSVDYEP